MEEVKKIENQELNELEKRLQGDKNQESSQNTLFLMSLISLFVGIVFITNSFTVSNFFTFYNKSSGYDYYTKQDADKTYEQNVLKNQNTVEIWGSLFILFTIAGFSSLYLSGFSFKRRKEKDFKINLNEDTKNYLEMISLLKSINKSIEKRTLESVLSINEKKEIINQITTTIESQLNNSLLDKIESIYGTAVYNEKLSTKSTKLLTETVKRLKLEVEKLQRKANYNLIFGLTFTIVAITIIVNVLMVLDIPKDVSTLTIVFYYTSRFFLVLLIQGISIFFLRLYKATLNDIMYMNNEVTNYEAKRDALSLAFSTGEVKSSIKMLDELANTERNFTLKKGETSIFNQRKSTEDDLVDNALLKELLSKLKNK